MKPVRDAFILDNIPFTVQAHECFELLRIKPGSRLAEDFSSMIAEARELARPRAAFRVTAVENHGDGYVDIDGVRFESRILQINLGESPVVFPFVATCGHELDEFSSRIEGTLHRFWADTIKMLALGSAMGILEGHLKERVHPAQLSCMNPGSLEDWPLQQQGPLFKLMGKATSSIGVSLTESYVLVPLKSVTGIQFISEEEFLNCQLCPRENCTGRRAPYDSRLYETRYSELANNQGKG